MTNNKSETERVNELKEKIEAHEARQLLASYSDDDPENFEGLDNEVAVKLAQTMAQSATRQNAHIDDELAGAVNASVSAGRAEWEQRKNGDGS